jgi:uncharacterized protein DUF87
VEGWSSAFAEERTEQVTLPIPVEVLNQHTAVLGKTRSGKSSVMRLLVENLLDRHQPVCIVDPKGDWWGIKLARDGKRPGYPVVIFGGEHADVPINAHAGAHVAELFATGNRPCLIDLGGWMVGERTRFWIDFASTLFKTTKGMRWLVVDEVHNFAPKGKIMDPDAGKALHWSNRLASEGLGKGLPMLFASQRPQKVHNDTLTSAETLIAMRVIHPSDRDAIAEWIKGCGDMKLGAEVLGTLAQLERGEGWVWSPEIGFGPKRVKFPMFKTYDSFRAQTAEDAKGLKGWAEVDLEDVKAKLSVVVKEAEANDPKLLKRRIAELEKATKTGPAQTIEKLVEVPVLKNGQLERTEAAIKRLEEVGAKATAEAAELRRLISPAFVAKPAPRPAPMQTATAVRPAHAKRTVATETGISKAERLILTALAQHGDCAKTKVAILTGYSVNGGGFNNAIGALRSKGFIEPGSEPLKATGEGIAALGDYDPLPSGPDLLDHWRRQLGKAEREILDVLVESYPEVLSKEETASRTPSQYEPSGGGFNNAIGRLRTLELIQGRGELKASDNLF